MRVLAFCGPSGSGKDELCDHLIRTIPDSVKWGFADYPKRLCSDLLGVPLSSFYKDKNQPSPFFWKDLVYLETRIPERYEPDRRLLNREVIQKWCEFFRKLNPSVWASKLRSFHQSQNRSGLLLINDLRFHEELFVVRDLGGKVIRLTRKHDCSAWREHVSEQEWKSFPVEYELDNMHLSLGETTSELDRVVKGWRWR